MGWIAPVLKVPHPSDVYRPVTVSTRLILCCLLRAEGAVITSIDNNCIVRSGRGRICAPWPVLNERCWHEIFSQSDYTDGGYNHSASRKPSGSHLEQRFSVVLPPGFQRWGSRFDGGRWFGVDEGLHEGIPVGDHEVGRDGADVLEDAFPGALGGPGVDPDLLRIIEPARIIAWSCWRLAQQAHAKQARLPHSDALLTLSHPRRHPYLYERKRDSDDDQRL